MSNQHHTNYTFPSHQSFSIDRNTAPDFSSHNTIRSDYKHRRFGFRISFSTRMKEMRGQVNQLDAHIEEQMQEFRHQWLSKPSIISKEQTLTLKWFQVES